jgi:hypothetical protein
VRSTFDATVMSTVATCWNFKERQRGGGWRARIVGQLDGVRGGAVLTPSTLVLTSASRS